MRVIMSEKNAHMHQPDGGAHTPTAIRARLNMIAVALELPSSEVKEAMKGLPALIDFANRHNQSLDYIIHGNIVPMLRILSRQH
jgi:hypothetical protein